MAVTDDLGTKATSGMGRPGAPYIEPLGHRILSGGLLDGRSFVSPHDHAWTVESASELMDVYVDSPDTSDLSFDEKLRRRLSTTSRAARVLFADLILLNLLPLGDYGANRKRELIALPLEDLDPPVLLPEEVEAALPYGMFRGGIGFKSGRYARLRWLITFAEYALSLPVETRRTALKDPLDFREFIRNAPGKAEVAQRHSIQYLAFPWFYLPTIIPEQRTQIRDALAGQYLPGGPTADVDVDLHRIYAAATQEAAGPVNFYQEPWLHRWMPQKKRPPCVWMLQADHRHRDDLALLEEVTAAAGSTAELSLVQHGGDVIAGDTVLVWIPGEAAGIYAIGTVTGPSSNQAHQEPGDETTSPAGIAIDIRIDRNLVKAPLLQTDLIANPILNELGVIQEPSASEVLVTELQWETIQKLLNRTPPVSGGTFDISWLVQETHWDREQLVELVDTIENRQPQIILAGPPGTGKTYVAERIAKHLVGGRSDATHIVQFHPSFAYEDFVEGLRPTETESGQVTFKVVPGILMKIADQARRSDHPVVLIIDEMNRANLPSVFGELLFLLEYRGKDVQLLHRERFSLPKNLYVIGTMNTADRSIRSIDTALRRRFDIFDCPPRTDVLSRFYDSGDNHSEITDLVEGMAELNARLRDHLDENHAVGHSFFIGNTYTRSDLQRSWDRQIYPLIREYFFDQPTLTSSFRIEEFWPSMKQS